MSNFQSPYIGWIVPHPWQEPQDLDPEDDDEIVQDLDDWSDYDDEGEFTLL